VNLFDVLLSSDTSWASQPLRAWPASMAPAAARASPV